MIHAGCTEGVWGPHKMRGIAKYLSTVISRRKRGMLFNVAIKIGFGSVTFPGMESTYRKCSMPWMITTSLSEPNPPNHSTQREVLALKFQLLFFLVRIARFKYVRRVLLDRACGEVSPISEWYRRFLYRQENISESAPLAKIFFQLTVALVVEKRRVVSFSHVKFSFSQDGVRWRIDPSVSWVISPGAVGTCISCGFWVTLNFAVSMQDHQMRIPRVGELFQLCWKQSESIWNQTATV